MTEGATEHAPDHTPIRVSGKPWKSQKTATKRSMLPRGVKQTFEERKRKESSIEAMKKLEREMKEEKDAERQVCRVEFYNYTLLIYSDECKL